MPLAWGLAAATEHLPVSIRPQTSGPDWQHVFPLVPAAAAVVLAVALRQLPWRLRAQVTTLGSAAAAAVTWREIHHWLSAGERPVASTEPDLFHHRPLALRIAEIVGREGRPVALLGRFGTGKSSILNIVRDELDRLRPNVIVASFDVWAVPKPDDVPRLALNRIVAALDDYADTIQFRSLPLAYQRLAAAEPTGRLSRVLGFNESGDSLAELNRLSPILEALNVRIVLIVEDVERAGRAFDTRHLERFLWALRRVERSTFVLAVDPDAAPLDFAKLCDTIERVPPVEVKQLARILTAAYVHWKSAFSYIDLHPNRRDGDKLRLEMALMEGMMEYLRRTGRDTPLDVLVSLLETPRGLKHVLRRVDRTWDRLHGEAELDDVLIVSALRHGAEPAYTFLLRDIDPARHKPDDIMPRTMTIKAAWDRLIGELPNGAAAQRLVDLMGIEQLTRGHAPNVTTAPQGVHESEPVDYFSRIVAEQLGPGELRDQTVLQDIDRWKADRTGALVDRLVAASDEDDQYQRVWEHFSTRHSESELLELTAVVVSRVLARDRAAASAKHPAILALWRRFQHVPKDQHAAWLRALILSAVPVSLQLVNGLYYFWTGERGIVDGTTRASIRESITEAVRSNIKTADDLARVLPKDRQYEVAKFIAQTGTQPAAEGFAEWTDHFGRLIIEGAKAHPETMMAELANLAGDDQSGITVADLEPPVFINRYKIDRPRLAAFLGDRLDKGLDLLAGYGGENVYAVRAKDDAAAWLKERRDSQPV